MSGGHVLDRHLGVVGAALVICAFVFAGTGIPAWIPQGALVANGIPSPLTGMTRSFVALAGGDVARAFAWHPLGPVAFGLCLVAAALGIGSLWRPPSAVLTHAVSSRRMWIVTALIVGGVWVRQIAVFA